MEELYGNIGNTLKRNYANSTAWFITSNMEALKYVGLRPSKKINLSPLLFFKLDWYKISVVRIIIIG